MTLFGWISLMILALIFVWAAIELFVHTPKSRIGKHALAVLPIWMGIVYALILPADRMFTDSAISGFTRTIVPLFVMLCTLPLVIKANKEIKKDQLK